MSHRSLVVLPLLLAPLLLSACGGGSPAPSPEGAGSEPGQAAARRLPADGIVAPADLDRYTSLKEPPLVLDVRTVAEHEGGHVPGSLNIPVQELPRRLPEIQEGRQRGVIVYCRSGRRARSAFGILENAGFTDLALLDGSMQRWEDEGRPIAKPAGR